MKEIQDMDLLNKMRKKMRIHLPYSRSSQLDAIQSNIRKLHDDARGIQTLSKALLFCMHLSEHQTGYISKEDANRASKFLLETALANEKKVNAIENQLDKIKEE